MSGGSLKVEQSLFQATEGGSIPTSPHPKLLELRQIDKGRAEACYEKWHYLGKQLFLADYNFGIFFKGDLYGCISLGSPNAKILNGYWTPQTQKGWFEIKRLALSDDCPPNSESRVIAIAVKLLRKIENVKGIITYADSGVGHNGTIYKASGFTYLGLTAQKSDFFLTGSSKPIQRGRVAQLNGEWKERSRKHLFIKLF